ncbi:MAG: hypothetical protein K2Q24_15340 [Chitinophagaceae bacterium]|nr:hypothetical protein [Chitinophagaceae bacterium]
MKKVIILFLFLTHLVSAAQVKPKPAPQKKPAQSEMDKMMEEAMQGMSPEEKAEMKKMMKATMPVLQEHNNTTADYPQITNNKELLPVKDINRINSISKKIFTEADIAITTTQLFGKLMTKADADQKTIINKVVSKEKRASGLMGASITAFLQGHRLAAIGLAMKAVLADNKNLIYQNNLAAILTQSGYSDKAIPYLRKLLIQQPGNSTLNNNLGYAWFYLGETDSATFYFNRAVQRNPAHTETRMARGVLAEIKNDHTKAVEEYITSNEESPNAVTEQMLNNRKNGNRVTQMDYKKMIGSITIYEFFTKEWSQLPEFENNVSAYQRNKAILRGYETMYKSLEKKLQTLFTAANMEKENLEKKDEEEYATTMMKESLKGITMMSKPAGYIVGILANEQSNRIAEDANTYKSLRDYIEAQQKIRNNAGNNPSCADIDAKSNTFMQTVNPKIKEYYQKRLDALRVWMNAMCTWRWFLVGNAKNNATAACFDLAKAFEEIHRRAVEEFKIMAPSCGNRNEVVAAQIKELPIPQFNCPVVVRMPANVEALRISATTTGLDENSFGIKYNGAAIPNVTMAFGVEKTHIAEPGLYGNPYIKTADGSINQSGFNYAMESDNDELVPLSKIPPMELVPLDKNLLNKKPKPVVKEDAQALMKAKLARDIMNKMLKTDCTTKFVVGMGELIFEEPKQFVIGEGELMLWNESKQKWEPWEDEGKLVVGIGELSFEEMPKGPVPGKLETVINNGLEMIKTTGNFIKNLFD